MYICYFALKAPSFSLRWSCWSCLCLNMMLAGASGSTADDSNRWPGAQRVAWCSAPDGEEGPCCCWHRPTCLNYLHYHYLMAHLFALSAVCIHYYIIAGPPVWIIRRSSKQDIWLQQAWKKLLTGGCQAVALGSLSSCRLIGEEPSVASTRQSRCAKSASSQVRSNPDWPNPSIDCS